MSVLCNCDLLALEKPVGTSIMLNSGAEYLNGPLISFYMETVQLRFALFHRKKVFFSTFRLCDHKYLSIHYCDMIVLTDH